ncbi:MAG: D-sedoheptulose 7-phosphate isomerase [Magnetococcales bacterium]|nr:D-sedoheptulose 7-phosphate isomerase [Magnetococcales bacterium]MBF0149749.1 D-sedoheptulose 7-phosphate isomerase [Magnetococcales bacterium]MBF0174518.1 D-sedoheptulose 7-phosphate isomerase [Magnetococcales bacterium]MBF0348168.1 D-sedoheptulose 7-phosphate isomerase [Magnetococcales bacterium]MBF0630690.1 D-sedoheptulose 7-phosphate isomerase [Magnetococcales bacterium]
MDHTENSGWEDRLRQQIRMSLEAKQAFLDDASLFAELVRACTMAEETCRHGHRILIAGNGGSAADAQHIAAELVSRFFFDRPALSALALTTDTSILTAIGNDYGFEHVFSRQIEAHGRAGDLFMAISTSGNSPNIIAAIEAARKRSMRIIGLTGRSGGGMAPLCDCCIRVASDSTPRIQEGHILVGHLIAAHVEQAMFGSGNTAR